MITRERGDMSPAALTVVTLIVVGVALMPVLWMSQDRLDGVFGRAWFQSLALMSFGLVAPLVVDLFNNNALDLQVRLATTFVLCGLVLPWLVSLVRTALEPYEERLPTERSRTKNYSSRRKRAGY